MLPSCLQKCEETLQGKVTNYLQQEVHPIPPGKSLCNLLQQQNVICCSDKVTPFQKNYVPIEEPTEGENTLSLLSRGKDNLQQDHKPSKRKREDESAESSSCDVRTFMESLRECRNIVGRLKDRNQMEKIDKDGALILLEEMISELNH